MTLTTLSLGENAIYSGGSLIPAQPAQTNSAFSISIPSGTSQFQFRFTATNNRFSENWCIDDVKLTGDTTTVASVSPKILPTVSIVADTTICSGNKVTLTSSTKNTVGVVTYAWTPKSGLVDSTLMSTSTTALTKNTDYQLTIIDADLCKTTSNIVHVQVFGSPAIVSQTTLADTACLGSTLRT